MSREEQILAYIVQTINEQGFPPTYREIGEAVGLKSTKNVFKYMQRLERAGKIERPYYGSGRAIRVVVGQAPPLSTISKAL